MFDEKRFNLLFRKLLKISLEKSFKKVKEKSYRSRDGASVFEILISVISFPHVLCSVFCVE